MHAYSAKHVCVHTRAIPLTFFCFSPSHLSPPYPGPKSHFSNSRLISVQMHGFLLREREGEEGREKEGGREEVQEGGFAVALRLRFWFRVPGFSPLHRLEEGGCSVASDSGVVLF